MFKDTPEGATNYCKHGNDNSFFVCDICFGKVVELSAKESCRDIKATKLRQILKVPKEQRIAQHIYNMCRQYEHNVSISTYYDGKFEDNNFVGIDIFHIEDDEFIKLMEKENE